MHRKQRAFELHIQLPRDRSLRSRSAREQAAKDYWDRLTAEQEGWVLKENALRCIGWALEATCLLLRRRSRVRVSSLPFSEREVSCLQVGQLRCVAVPQCPKHPQFNANEQPAAARGTDPDVRPE